MKRWAPHREKTAPADRMPSPRRETDIAHLQHARYLTDDIAAVTAYMAGREVRWQATYAHAVKQADDDRGRLLAVFDALRTACADPALRGCAFPGTADFAQYEIARLITATHRFTLRKRMVEIAERQQLDDPVGLVVELLTLCENAAREYSATGRLDVVEDAQRAAEHAVDAQVVRR